jgi:hypothetical protein
MDALQVFVRGFETAEAGDNLVEKLQDIGFQIAMRAGGGVDSLGGIIETYITPVIHLDPEDVEDIANEIYEVVGPEPSAVFVQYLAYECTEDCARLDLNDCTEDGPELFNPETE